MAEVTSPVAAYWSSKQAASYLGMSEADLRFMRYMGKGPRPYKFGVSKRSRVKYLIDDVKAWPEEMTRAYNQAHAIPASVKK